MKKYMNLLKVILILICLIMLVWLILFIVKDKQKMCEQFDFNDVLLEVNLSTNNSFNKLDTSSTFQSAPIVFEEDDNYLFAADQTTGDYFILAKNLNEKQIFDLKSFVDVNNELYDDKQVFFAEHNEYIYVIYSNEYRSFIDGIIRSFIYC